MRDSNLVLTWKVIFVDQTLGDELKLTKLTAFLIHSGETSFPMVKIIISAAQSPYPGNFKLPVKQNWKSVSN